MILPVTQLRGRRSLSGAADKTTLVTYPAKVAWLQGRASGFFLKMFHPDIGKCRAGATRLSIATP